MEPLITNVKAAFKAVSELTDELAQLRAENANYRSALAGKPWYHDNTAVMAELGRVRAENEELKRDASRSLSYSDVEFTAARLRRVAKLLGLAEAIPTSDESLVGCAGTVLGMVAREIEALKAQLATTKEQGAEDMREAAERWRALVNCARVRVLGSAGIVEPKPEGYAHIGVEFWTHHPAKSEPMAIDHLIKFANIARALPLTQPTQGGE